MNSASKALTERSRGDLEHYDPEKGLKEIAILEGIEKYYATAKDATGLRAAIEKKLAKQHEFVEWWDGNGFSKPGSPFVTERLRIAGRDGMPERMTISRWRQRLSPNKFDDTVAKTVDRSIKIAEFRQSTGSTAGVNMPESNEWYTPARYVEAARRVLGDIDLDPASSEQANAVVKAAQIFTRDDDGLVQPWHGRVWMNPPYSGQAAAFVERLMAAVESGDVSAAVLLVNSHGTDTRWFQPLWDGLLCFTDHRINFISPQGGEESGSNHGSVFAYFGSAGDMFAAEFSKFGTVVQRY